MLKRYFFLFAALAFASSLHAQFYPLGLNSPQMRWKQINTDKIRLVFPTELSATANRTASLLHYLEANNTATIGDQTQKITVYLQSQNTLPNGFVALSPFRSEFYMTPPQANFLGPSDWADILAVHEYRHVLQNTNVKRGVSKAVSWVFGQNGWAFMRAMALPRWFAEGDAIIVETALTNAGRGRLPDFHKEYRALWRAEKDYNYEKASAGSLRDFVPSHYHLGYYLSTYARKHHGAEIWEDIVHDSGKYKGIFYPLSRNLKKRTGMNTPRLYQKTMQEMDSLWEAQLAEEETQEYEAIPIPKPKVFTQYRNPRFLDDSTLIIQKSSFREINQLYSVSLNGEEKFLTNIGFNVQFNAIHSIAKNEVVWNEVAYHKRWAGTTFSNLKRYDIESNSKTKLTQKSNFFSIDISQDAKQLITVELLDSMQYVLSILDANSGDRIRQIPNPEGYFYSIPRWSVDGEKVVVVVQKNNRNAIALVEVNSGKHTFLTPWVNEQLLRPILRDGYVYFSASFSKIQNIYALKLADKSLYQVTRSSADAFYVDVSPSGKQLVFTSFTAMGHQLHLLEIKPNEWEKLASYPVPIYQNANLLAQQEGGDQLDDLEIESYEQKKYSQLSGLLNIHSMQPFVLHPNYRLELQSDNTFTTLSAAAGLNYNANENNMSYYGTVTYGGLFPAFDVNVTTARERERVGLFISEAAGDTLSLGAFLRNWQETNVSFGMTLPFNLMQGNHFADLLLSARYHFISVDHAPSQFRFDPVEQARDGMFNALSFEAEFSRFRTSAVRQINPRFGQYFRFRYNTTLEDEVNQGRLLQLDAALYWPGLFKTHSFFVTAGHRSEPFLNGYLFRNNFFYARGYESQVFHDRLSRLSFNYAFPLFYPDVALGSFAFVQRIKMNLFYDTSRAEIDPIRASDILNNTEETVSRTFSLSNANYRSMGAELTFDFRAFRLLNVELGARYSYLLDANNTNINANQFDFLLLRIEP